jgi:hypothetical protein
MGLENFERRPSLGHGYVYRAPAGALLTVARGAAAAPHGFKLALVDAAAGHSAMSAEAVGYAGLELAGRQTSRFHVPGSRT